MGENNTGSSGRKKVLKATAVIICSIILCIIVGAAAYFYVFLSSISGNSRDINASAVAAGSGQSVNILIAGMDAGIAGTSDGDNTKKADTIFLVNYDTKNKKANIISIPKDTMIKDKGKRQKLSASVSYGGADYLTKNIESLLGVKVNYYVQVDYEGFINIVDSFGGVDMKINNDMNYDDPNQNLKIHFIKGETVHLDGSKAEEFFRWERNNDGTGLADGDLGRIKNQHALLSQVIQKLERKSTFFKAPKILSTFSKNIETNMTPAEIIKYAKAMYGLKREDISISTLKGAEVHIEDENYFIVNSKQDSIAAFKNMKEVTVNKANLKLQVLNSTAKNGLAKTFAENISKKGYTLSNITTGNAAKKGLDSKVTIYAAKEEYIPAIKDDLGINNVEFVPQKSGKFDIIIVLGNDQAK
ncbi:MAG: LCP family protein [Bacillota bacterium]|nr:LCP family protein [Bacillota bacterium]